MVSERYVRQQVLPQIGEAGQARLAAGRVLIVGAGGLGCAALPYLAAAGVGQLALVDPDRVEESNLHRQVLYRMADLGQRKVQAARAALLALNPATAITAYEERLTPANAAERVRAVDVVLDCADSFAVTYALSDACQEHGRALVSASVLALSGYVGVFCGGAPSYRAVFPELPRAAGSCAHSGVLGSAVGVVGTLQAHLALALLLQLQPSPLGRLFSLDLAALHLGGFSFSGAEESAAATLPFIAREQVRAQDLVIDLRAEHEAPRAAFPQALRLSLESLEQAAPQIPSGARVVLCCRSGVRAWRAARALQRQGHHEVALIALGE